MARPIRPIPPELAPPSRCIPRFPRLTNEQAAWAQDMILARYPLGEIAAALGLANDRALVLPYNWARVTPFIDPLTRVTKRGKQPRDRALKPGLAWS